MAEKEVEDMVEEIHRQSRLEHKAGETMIGDLKVTFNKQVETIISGEL